MSSDEKSQQIADDAMPSSPKASLLPMVNPKIEMTQSSQSKASVPAAFYVMYVAVTPADLIDEVTYSRFWLTMYPY